MFDLGDNHSCDRELEWDHHLRVIWAWSCVMVSSSTSAINQHDRHAINRHVSTVTRKWENMQHERTWTPNAAACVTVCNKKLHKGGTTTSIGGRWNKISKIHHAMESSLIYQYMKFEAITMFCWSYRKSKLNFCRTPNSIVPPNSFVSVDR